jgi:hypothetical protein
LQERGILFISPDYRNFPQGQVPDMVRDVAEAVKWTKSHAHLLGGDSDNVTLIGQSAGAHLVMMCVIEAAEADADAAVAREAREEGRGVDPQSRLPCGDDGAAAMSAGASGAEAAGGAPAGFERLSGSSITLPLAANGADLVHRSELAAAPARAKGYDPAVCPV